MTPLFEAILEHVPARDDDPDGPLQLQISSLDYSSYVGQIGIGRIYARPHARRPGRARDARARTSDRRSRAASTRC